MVVSRGRLQTIDKGPWGADSIGGPDTAESMRVRPAAFPEQPFTLLYPGGGLGVTHCAHVYRNPW